MKRKIRVLHIINGADLGGISVLLLNYYRVMDRDAFHFDFVYTMETLGYNAVKFQEMGSKFYKLPLKSKHPIKYYFSLKTLIVNGDYTVIHSHTNFTSYFDLIIAKRFRIKHRVAHAHTNEQNKKVTFRVKQFLSRKLHNKYATRLISSSVSAQECVFGKNLKVSSTILKPAIDIKNFRFNNDKRLELLIQYGLSNKIVVGNVGRMSQEKNLFFLLDIFKKLREIDGRFVLVMIGSGPLHDEILDYSRNQGIEKYILFLGQKENVSELMNLFDVVIIPSFNEGFCISALEAISNGILTFVSSNVPSDMEFSKLITYLSLDLSSQKWADEVVSRLQNNEGHIDNSVEIQSNGFDILQNVKDLELVYKEGE
ncbi:glycosyltransferase [Candidatus Izimaplasma bacterium ZiA1]|uniref:glycosyltransferase n=1 Tax=Candidatus Izimoplasma sp. ZiA1 TaxID=2024899 RepID=UPI00143AE9BD